MSHYESSRVVTSKTSHDVVHGKVDEAARLAARMRVHLAGPHELVEQALDRRPREPGLGDRRPSRWAVGAEPTQKLAPATGCLGPFRRDVLAVQAGNQAMIQDAPERERRGVGGELVVLRVHERFVVAEPLDVDWALAAG